MSLFLIKIKTNLSCLSPHNTSYYETNKRNAECCNFARNFFSSKSLSRNSHLEGNGNLIRTVTASYEDYKDT
ncbi:hypothetical protein OIU78_017192 [Salix suchowensis]|nr:hypothetical protein OIU78_017192 [Salix suchowensis]